MNDEAAPRPPITVRHDARGVATVTLDRPQVHNAFDEHTIEALSDAFLGLADEAGTRVVVLRGNGPSFSSGGDANWMRRMAGAGLDTNRADAARLALMLRRLAALPQPVVCCVHGNAFGGALGLMSACDVVVAAHDTRLALSEVRLGLVPAVISPYVVEAIGARAARRWSLTGEVFDADTACAMGLVHVVAAPGALDETLQHLLAELLRAAPLAQREAKRLMRQLAAAPAGDGTDTDAMTTALIARIRESDEGREGLAAFLEKRKPAWRC
jgi:methylglutaconyl-CoA hydratase